MNPILIAFAVFFPILAAIPLPLVKFKSKRSFELVTEAIVILTSIVVWMLLLNRPEEQCLLISLSQNVDVTFHIDGLGMVFAGLISILWPIATLYSFEYMEHEERQEAFFMYYTMTYGVTLGIAFAGNLLSMYVFYELLTLVTVPLVIHTFTREAVLATKKYIYYSMGGAAMGFMGVIFMIKFGSGAVFTMGGTLTGSFGLDMNVVLGIFVLAFLGFSIKAAMFPFYAWIPDAGVAPTPVTALLHAVAVVKAGAFAVIRLTYYCFGPDLLRGTWAQYVVMSLAVFTIVFGCSMAVKETHMKRRLAFSTVSNLSYIIFGATIMTPAGLTGGLMHMVFHAVMKISAFFCVGSIMHMTEKNFVHETTGFGWKMPWVYTAFTVSSLGMMGVPGTCGFISKWYLANAALESNNVLAYIGLGGLLVSALLTAIYMMSFVIRGFYPQKDFDYEKISYVKDPTWKMILPLMSFTVAIIAFGLCSQPLFNFIVKVAAGL